MTNAFSLHAFADEAAQANALGALLGLRPQFIGAHIFPDGEILPRTSSPGVTAIIYRSLNRPNQKLIELLLTADACRRAGAHRLLLVAPYMAYMRQDAVFSPGEPNSQIVIGGMLGGAFDRIVTVDAHLHRTPRITDVFAGIEADNLHGANAIAHGVGGAGLPGNALVVGPDLESRQWVEVIAAQINREAAVFIKARHDDRHVTLDLPAGLNIAGRPIILADDICSSGSTLVAATAKLRQANAQQIDIVVTHALFNTEVERTLLASGATSIRSTDSCTHSTNAFALAPLLAAALEKEKPR